MLTLSFISVFRKIKKVIDRRSWTEVENVSPSKIIDSTFRQIFESKVPAQASAIKINSCC